MFDGFFSRIRTVMGLGAWHGRRGYPRDDHGIAIPVWGAASTDDSLQSSAEGQDNGTEGTNVTPITIVGGKSNV